jgi:hypothetical protein
MTETEAQPSNVVDFLEYAKNKKLKEQQKLEAEAEGEEFDPDSVESIQLLCADTINELFDYLESNFDIDLTKKESMQDLILFLESYKSLMMRVHEKEHPFQQLAHKIFSGVSLEETEDGESYKYVFSELEKNI